ncbi:MAG: class I SAM-dependent methyltransferase [Silicimonas sp.]|nr:class I SAM-dependent methyltransferase [Silicimonas sp.]
MTDKDIASYTDQYMGDYGFEAEMVRARRKLVLDRLAFHRPDHIVELGCGNDLQLSAYQTAGGVWKSWTIVEPSEDFATRARAAAAPNLTVIEAFFEDAVSSIAPLPDMVLCSGLLHEVPDSDRLLEAINAVMKPGAILHLNVPNARSMHRQLALAMGLIEDLKEMSARNTALQQPRVYDLATLTGQLETHGFRVQETGGHLVKPFTHHQMEKIAAHLGPNVLDGLYELGRRLPDLASEIFVEAVKA